MAMGLTKQDLKAVEMMLRELPKPEYEDLCDFNRHYTERYTREYIAEELGMSVSTFDRRKKAILKRIAKYANKAMAALRHPAK